jgi:hypothetical protein
MCGTFERQCEADPTPRQKVVILGSRPNRIGQASVRLLLLSRGLRAARRRVRDSDGQLQSGRLDRLPPSITLLSR